MQQAVRRRDRADIKQKSSSGQYKGLRKNKEASMNKTAEFAAGAAIAAGAAVAAGAAPVVCPSAGTAWANAAPGTSTSAPARASDELRERCKRNLTLDFMVSPPPGLLRMSSIRLSNIYAMHFNYCFTDCKQIVILRVQQAWQPSDALLRIGS